MSPPLTAPRPPACPERCRSAAPAPAPAHTWPLAVVASLTLLLGACGQKGPLYLPNARKAPVAPSPGGATPSSVPAQATPPAQAAPAARPPKPQSQSSQPDDSQPPAGDSSATGQSPAA
ncbi:MAG TPA: lipoprotein [Steroidobacteraceae bacterium]|nr:lipoprotein [Steroidobacteraceae bacterium]